MTIVAVAANASVANSVAVGLFTVLLQTQDLRDNVTRVIPALNPLDIVVASVRAEYYHPVDGLIVIEGSLPPPPPFAPPPPALPPLGFEDLLAAQTAVVTTLSLAVATSVAASVGAAVASAAASATASASASAAAGSSGGGAAGGGGGASGGGGSAAGGVMPLVFGARMWLCIERTHQQHPFALICLTHKARISLV